MFDWLYDHHLLITYFLTFSGTYLVGKYKKEIADWVRRKNQ